MFIYSNNPNLNNYRALEESQLTCPLTYCYQQPQEYSALPITTLPQQPSDNKDKKINQIVEAGLTTAVNIGAATALATSHNQKDILSLTSAQILTTTAKNLLKKASVPKVVSYPVLIGSGIAAFFCGASIVSDICFTIAAKNFTKDMKSVIKGKPIRLILTEGIDTNLKRLEQAKNCFPCTKSAIQRDQETAIVNGEDSDSESEDIEFTPPPKWVQIALIGSVAIAGGICYTFLPLPNTGIELLNTTSKMATVALRKLPLVPAGGVALAVGGAGAAVNYAVTGNILSGTIAGPALSFPLDVATDNLKVYIKGKWNDRALLPTLPCQNEQMPIAAFAEKKKQDPEPPSDQVQTAILVTDAALAIGTNFAQPQGGMLPQKAAGLFTSLFGITCIKGQADTSALGRRMAGYSLALAGAYLFDAMVTTPIKLSKVVGSAVLKLAATKEIKNLSNLDFVGGFERMKEKITGCNHQ